MLLYLFFDYLLSISPKKWKLKNGPRLPTLPYPGVPIQINRRQGITEFSRKGTSCLTSFYTVFAPTHNQYPDSYQYSPVVRKYYAKPQYQQLFFYVLVNNPHVPSVRSFLASSLNKIIIPDASQVLRAAEYIILYSMKKTGEKALVIRTPLSFECCRKRPRDST